LLKHVQKSGPCVATNVILNAYVVAVLQDTNTSNRNKRSLAPLPTEDVLSAGTGEEEC